MAFNPKCIKKYNKDKDSEVSTKNYFVAHEIFDKYYNIPKEGLKDFQDALKWANNKAKLQGVDKPLYYTENHGLKAIPNKEAFREINKIKETISKEPSSNKELLKDGKYYDKSEISASLLEDIRYTPAEIGRFLKESCK